METTLYTFGFSNFWGNVIFVTVLNLISVANLIKDFKQVKRPWFSIVGEILVIIVSIVFIFSRILQFASISGEYRRGELPTVSGTVENFVTYDEKEAENNADYENPDEESFRINGIDFSYDGDENFGYCRWKYNDGVITGNGQKLKITYYEKSPDERVICEIVELK